MAGEVGVSATGLQPIVTRPSTATAAKNYPVVPASTLIAPTRRVVKRGSGLAQQSEPLLALWTAAGMPATLGLAVSDTATAGLFGIAAAGTATTYGIVAVTGLTLRNGKLYGQLAIASGTLPSATAQLSLNTWYFRELFPAMQGAVDGYVSTSTGNNLSGLRIAVRSGDSVSLLSYRATNAKGDDTYISYNATEVLGGEAYPGPLVTMLRWPMPYAADEDVQVLYQTDSPERPSNIIGTRDQLLTAVRSASLRGIDREALGNGSMPIAWVDGAVQLSRASVWVRRVSWADSSKMIRHEAGLGEAPAVMVIQSSTVVRRVVTAADFGEAEYLATDWVPAMPLDGSFGESFDLTALSFQLRSSATGRWLIWKEGQTDVEPTGECDCCECP